MFHLFRSLSLEFHASHLTSCLLVIRLSDYSTLIADGELMARTTGLDERAISVYNAPYNEM